MIKLLFGFHDSDNTSLDFESSTFFDLFSDDDVVVGFFTGGFDVDVEADGVAGGGGER